MKKIFKYALASLISVVSFASCVKDNGNYDYSNIPSPKISGFDIKVNDVAVTPEGENNLIRIKQGDLLNITPTMTLEDGFEAQYSWKTFLKTPILDSDSKYEQPKEIGTQKNLNVNIELSPEIYTLSYKIINTKNNTEFISTFEVQIQSIVGMFVYHQDASMKGDYSAIRTPQMLLNIDAAELGVIRNIYSGSNNGAKIENPHKLLLRNINSIYGIFATTKGGMKIVDYNKLTLTSDDYSTLFQYSFPEPGFTVDCHLNGVNKKEYMIDRGSVYAVDYMVSGGSRKFGAHMGGAGKLYAPFAFTVEGSTSASGASVTVNQSIFFNSTDKRFETTSSTSMSQFSTASGEVKLEKTEMNLLYMSKISGLTFGAVMKDAQNKLNFVKFTMTNRTIAACDTKIDLSVYSEVTENSKWAIGGRGEAAFISSGNQVNIFNHNFVTMRSSGIILPAGAEIAELYVLKDATNEKYDNAVLYVCYNVGNDGFVDQYEFNPISGDVTLSSKQSFSGFGKIINVVLKK